MSKQINLTTALVCGLFVMTATAISVRTRGRTADARITAVVDLDEVFENSRQRLEAVRKVNELRRTSAERYDETGRLQFVTPDELDDFSNALNTDPATEASKQKVNAIREMASKRNAEFNKLATTADAQLTDKDRARMRELSRMKQGFPELMNLLRNVYQAKVNEEDAKVTRAARREIAAIVGKLAKDQGITEVYDQSSMVYNATDLTQAAIAKVKPEKKN